MADTFGTPEISQEQSLQPSGNSKTVIILLILIVIGGAVLGYLLYKQNNEPDPVLEEVTESVEIPTTPATGISAPAAIPTTPITDNSAGGTIPANTPGGTVNPAE